MPSTIGVLTFHRCINYGSYWQARALNDGLRRRGHAALILDHHARDATRAEWRNAFQPTLPQRTRRGDYRAYAAKARRFQQAFRALPLSRPFPLERPEEMDPCDLVVVGSDEVWNFRHPWYAARPAFFGEGLRTRRLVAYAASFGCHDAGEGLGEAWAERLRRFASLAVRDANSRRIVQHNLGAEPWLVLDPCLQFADSVRRAEAPAEEGREAVIYGHNFPAALAAKVRAWAKARDVRLVSIGYRNDWADRQHLDAGPEEFADALGGARAVITNFFHGCVFALANDRPFVCTGTDYRWHKVASLMEVVAARERLLAGDADGDVIEALLDRPPGAPTRQAVSQMRQRSDAYLDHALA